MMLAEIDSRAPATAIAVAEAVGSGAVSCTTLVETLLARIEDAAPLAAFITVDAERVRRDAARVDRLRAEGAAQGPLFGVPIAVKDNVDVAGLPSTAGTPALAGNVPIADSEIVARLRDAGAIILGKTNMHELAAGVTTNNARFGTARNPYDRDRVPGGSSGGSAIAVAAGLAPVALGTDTGASNRLPAAWCGVVGFRPSTGRWPQQGMVMNSPTRDTAGPMAHDVADCALIDAVVTGEGDAATPALSSLRIGVPRAAFWQDLDPGVAEMCEAVLDTLSGARVQLIEMDLPLLHETSNAASTVIAMHEHPRILDAYLGAAGAGFASSAVFAGIASPDVQAFLGGFHGAFSDADYARAMQVDRPALQAIFADAFARHRVDAMIFPTAPMPAPLISEENEIRHGGRTQSTIRLAIRNTNPGSIAGIPGISLPAGMTRGLPVGIELDGPVGSDRTLLAIAAAIEPLLPDTPPPGAM